MMTPTRFGREVDRGQGTRRCRTMRERAHQRARRSRPTRYAAVALIRARSVGADGDVGASAAAPSAINLVVSPAIKAVPVITFKSDDDIPARAIVGIEPGRLYNAYDRATRTYWALAPMVVAGHVSEQVGIPLQDGDGKGARSSQWRPREHLVPGRLGDPFRADRRSRPSTPRDAVVAFL